MRLWSWISTTVWNSGVKFNAITSLLFDYLAGMLIALGFLSACFCSKVRNGFSAPRQTWQSEWVKVKNKKEISDKNKCMGNEDFHLLHLQNGSVSHRVKNQTTKSSEVWKFPVKWLPQHPPWIVKRKCTVLWWFLLPLGSSLYIHLQCTFALFLSLNFSSSQVFVWNDSALPCKLA